MRPGAGPSTRPSSPSDSSPGAWRSCRRPASCRRSASSRGASGDARRASSPTRPRPASRRRFSSLRSSRGPRPASPRRGSRPPSRPALILLVLGDAGSRAGLIGALTAAAVYVIWALTRLVAGTRGGRRWRVAWGVGALAILAAAALATALSWPSRGAVRSALATRIEASFRRRESPAEGTPERALLYEAGWSIFRKRPVAGIGLGGFRAEFPNEAAALGHPVRWTDNPPSLYLGTLVESGLAGGLILLLLLLAVARGAGSALFMVETSTATALPAVGAASALIGLLVVFLFGSHLIYPEIATLVGILTARLPIRPGGRTARLFSSALPVTLAGVLALLLGNVAWAAWTTRSPDAAFRWAPTAGLWGPEREPDGRRFRWTSAAAAWLVPGTPGTERTLSLPVRNARPDGQPVALDVSWNGRPSPAASPFPWPDGSVSSSA